MAQIIDIHTHILPGVDDGSKSTEISLKLLKTLESEGVTDVILTPHFRGRYRQKVDVLQQKFESFQKKIEKEQIKINLYLGEEIFYLDDYVGTIKDGYAISLANGKYILMEFPYKDFVDIEEIAYNVTTTEFLPVIAHVERYEYATIDMVEEIRGFGGLIQVNAASIMGMNSNKANKFARKLLRKRLIDIVASDIHDGRKSYLTEAYAFVKKKTNKEYAQKIFYENPKKIIEK